MLIILLRISRMHIVSFEVRQSKNIQKELY
uniref:Uncharacterized protein n=1 Tax=Musa acuminata subsp. malaccensis TaxID=214687 RepID=A0A804JCP4_MUSAM